MANKKRSELRECVELQLAKAGIKDYEIKNTGGGHQKACFEVYGKKCSYVFPSTASDWRALKNTEAGIRRLLSAATGPSVSRAPLYGSVLDARGVPAGQPDHVGGRGKGVRETEIKVRWPVSTW